MPKKQQEPTALRPRSHRPASSAVEESGLIAKQKKAAQSVRTKSALDNRSHRTTDVLAHVELARRARDPRRRPSGLRPRSCWSNGLSPLYVVGQFP